MKLTKISLLFFVALFSISNLCAQTTDPKDTEIWEPEPRVVTPGEGNTPPSDAIVLFNGNDLDQWTSTNGGFAQWKVEDGAMTVVKGTGDIETKQKFEDFQLHIEWRSPSVIEGEGQGRGNSGIFLQGIYEVQVLDSYKNRTYSNGQAGSIYKQTMPLVNAKRPPGTWDVYDIIYKAPRFNKDGIIISYPTVTVIHNGIVIQNHTTIRGTTPYVGLPQVNAHGPGPIRLQDHDNPVSFRNIWIREL